jgi:hypothetical protein
MNPPENNKSGPADGNLAASEANLGHTLTLIHRALAHLDDPSRAMTVQSALLRACDYLDKARRAHASELGVAIASPSAAGIESEIAAVIAAAVSVVLGRPHRLVSMEPVAQFAPAMNAWALEGRTQIFMSHKVR